VDQSNGQTPMKSGTVMKPSMDVRLDMSWDDAIGQMGYTRNDEFSKSVSVDEDAEFQRGSAFIGYARCA